jgi:beta-glucuronidase
VKPPPRRILLAALLALACLSPASAPAADIPSSRTLYHDGPTGRFLMDGGWLFRLDATGEGLARRYYRETGTAGWSPVSVPNAWNTGDESEASLAGSVAWYRNDFELPDRKAALEWAVRFESVNYRARVWLNGREIGSHAGASLPFTLRAKGLHRRGVNRLVVRVDSRRTAHDLPPFRLSARGTGTGGWWNYGGILREVYLERLDTVSFENVRVLPELACSRCGASVDFAVRLGNVTSRTWRVSAGAGFGARGVRLGSTTLRAGRSGELRARLRVASPRLWSPSRPYLYPVVVRVRVNRRVVGTYSLHVGVRSLRVSSTGKLYLNGRPVNLRGVGVHEDSRSQGFAVDNAWRRRLVSEAEAAGARLLRSHYPLHPYIHELADREGLLIWSEVPVYQLSRSAVGTPGVRARALRVLRANVETNLDHASVAVWSIANELSSRPNASQARYIREAAATVRSIDRTRPVGIALAGYPSAGCQRRAYAPLDLLGVNDYFGWYPGPDGHLMDRANLSPYLDQLRRCYPRQALVVSEFGAEANREGPPEEKGTYAFQRDYVNFHLGVFASKPWLSGAIYWALNEFRIKPDWEGGNPRPSPPLHQKGLLNYDTWARKPAWEDVRRWFAATQQF